SRAEELASALARAEAGRAGAEERLAAERKETEALHRSLREQFEDIARRVMVDSARAVQVQQKENLGEILVPLREKLESFERRVDETHRDAVREHQSLKEQLSLMQKLNQTIGEEARNLTAALRGEAKTRGTWGELVLERVLEISGLQRDVHYTVQESIPGGESARFQPDVIVRLPGNRQIVIDSKVSLAAYERYAAAETEEQRREALKEHLASLRRHVRDLGGKNYQALPGLNTLDFVLMFIPMEPAFGLALSGDLALLHEAYGRNIVPVSPSTLLATLRTIANIWRQESQNRNAAEIARQGGALYDKFTAFVEDLKEVGSRLEAAQKSHRGAMNKLSEGSGNLIRRAENLRELGARTTRTLERERADEAPSRDLPPPPVPPEG
ncbi:MAG: DNA recombination protein RmuC, partial [Bacteroidota bacterium]